MKQSLFIIESFFASQHPPPRSVRNSLLSMINACILSEFVYKYHDNFLDLCEILLEFRLMAFLTTQRNLHDIRMKASCTCCATSTLFHLTPLVALWAHFIFRRVSSILVRQERAHRRCHRRPEILVSDCMNVDLPSRVDNPTDYLERLSTLIFATCSPCVAIRQGFPTYGHVVRDVAEKHRLSCA
uniref:AlNc14C119G6621 protein n=1 Tax=Albugo laibachii Nc14 TaxID=890382 RepID=F0WJ89_9STRA|nr:AlNc14C119G6621 [Albugo laibachii Nc14]|eukprot:CCA21336.1 AlNc14C119G6621 [Albugo laibachii Nc14]